MVKVWRISGREAGVLIIIGIATSLIDHRLESALLNFLFGIPAVVGFSDSIFYASGGPLFGDFLQVWEQYGAVLAAYLVRKPGAGTLAMTLNGFGQVIFNGTHAPHLLYGVSGLGADITFALFGYKRYDARVAALAGIAASLSWYPIVFFSHAVYSYPVSFVILDLAVRILGSALGDGVVGVAIGVAILAARQRFLRRRV